MVVSFFIKKIGFCEMSCVELIQEFLNHFPSDDAFIRLHYPSDLWLTGFRRVLYLLMVF